MKPRFAALAARYATEVNTLGAPNDELRERKARLDRACAEAGRDPATLGFSVMTACFVGETGRGRARAGRGASCRSAETTPTRRRSSPSGRDRWLVGTRRRGRRAHRRAARARRDARSPPAPEPRRRRDGRPRRPTVPAAQVASGVMTTTELTGAEDVAWDLSDLYDGGDDPRIEQDVEQTEAAAAAFRERYYGGVAGLSPADLREAIEERERIESTFTRAIYYAHLWFATDMNDSQRGALVARAHGEGRGDRHAAPLLRARARGARGRRRPTRCSRATELEQLAPLAPHDPQVPAVRPHRARGEDPHREVRLRVQRLGPAVRRAPRRDQGRPRRGGDRRSRRRCRSSTRPTATCGDAPPRPSPTRSARGCGRARSSSTRSPSTSRSTTGSAGTRPGSRARNLSNDTTDEAVQALIDAVVGRYDVVQRYYTLKAKLARARPPLVLRPHGAARRGHDAGRLGRGEAARARRVRRLLDRDGRHRRALLRRRAGSTRRRATASGPAPSARRTCRACTRTCFMNYTGDRRSVLTLAHELGHGLHGYLAQPLGLFNASHAADDRRDRVRVRRGAHVQAPPRDRGGPAAPPEPARRSHRGLDRDRLPADRDEPLRGRRPHVAARRGRALAGEVRGALARVRRRGSSATPSTSTATAPGGATSRTSSGRPATSTRTRTASSSRSRSSASTSSRATRWSSRTSTCCASGGSKPPEELAEMVGLDLTDRSIWDAGIDALSAELDEAEALAGDIGLGYASCAGHAAATAVTPSSAASISRSRSTSPRIAGGRVVEEERLREADDRVRERRRVDGRLGRRPRATSSSMNPRIVGDRCRGWTTPPLDVRMRSASRSSSRKLPKGGAAARLRLMRSNVSSSAAPPLPRALGARLVEERLGGPHDHLSDEPFPRAEPAVDRRASEPELGCDGLDVDPLAVEVAGGARRRGRPRGSLPAGGRAGEWGMPSSPSCLGRIDTRGAPCNHFRTPNRDGGGVVSSYSGIGVPAVRSRLTGRNRRAHKEEDSVRKLVALATVLVAALALTVPGAIGGPGQTPGVTAKSIVIGGTFPLTGPAASYAPIPLGHEGVLRWVNARKGPDKKRGVMGRQIVCKYYDDGYNPANTAQLTRRLVEQDKVFATVGQLGTEPQPRRSRVPEPAEGPAGARLDRRVVLGRLAVEEFPWTIGWQPDYIAEGRLYGLHIKANHAGKKIARHLPERRLRQGLPVRVPRRARARSTPTRTSSPRRRSSRPRRASAAQMTRIRASRCPDLRRLPAADPDCPVASRRARRSASTRPDLHELGRRDQAGDRTAMVGAAGAAYVNGLITIAVRQGSAGPEVGQRRRR